MDVFEARRINLKELIRDRFEGNRAAFSRATGKNPNLINLLLSKNSDYQRNIGEKLARDIEERMQLDSGWLDRINEGPAGKQQQHVVIKALNGTGKLYLCRKYYTKHVPAEIENARYIVADEDAMSPTINQEDSIIVDTSFSSYVSDGVYCFVMHDKTYVRRLTKQLNGRMLVTCDNPSCQPVELSAKEEKTMRVLGKAAAVLQCKKL